MSGNSTGKFAQSVEVRKLGLFVVSLCLTPRLMVERCWWIL